MGATGEEQGLEDEELCLRSDQGKKVPVVLSESRHTEAILPYINDSCIWRAKERMKTVSVALILCLNIPVDPPDVVKLNPCARIEAWVDPLSIPPSKAGETIGASLQKAYERAQPKARYKIAADPTLDDIKKLCVALRRNAKEERVLFHYNGHGVPRPTDNGELWVFNSNFTQYIPMSVYDLQQWMGVPSIYVYDVSHAGKIVKLFKTFSKMQDDDVKCIQFASCGERELLPMNPDLPADVFTACLTTPVKMAVRYYYLQNKKVLPADLTWEMLDRVPGALNDRRTMLGELNWIFTAVTDTIAWNTLPRELFQKLFRQDLLVSSLFRNYILAQRVMRSYDCTPVSSPYVPCTYQNHMWTAWDLVVKLCLSQLPKLLSYEDPNSRFTSLPFFEEQLTGFQVWLSLGTCQRRPPQQLPILQQVLLSQGYRPRALELLMKFLEIGPWAVKLVLEVGIFPYILRLLQSSAKDLRPPLSLLWSKTLAVDPVCICKVDLRRENGIRYFLEVMRDTSMTAAVRTMGTFVMCNMMSDCPEKDFISAKKAVLPLCLELIQDEHPPLKLWATICAAHLWAKRSDVRWEATRDNATEKLEGILKHKTPEVRAAAVYALGIFIRSLPLGDSSVQGKQINHNIAVSLKSRISEEASPLVRHELVVALHCLILLYESSFLQVIRPVFNETAKDFRAYPTSPSGHSSGRASIDSESKHSDSSVSGSSPASPAMDASLLLTPPHMRRTSSVKSLSSPGLSSSLSYSHLYVSIWEAIVQLSNDPFPSVATSATRVYNYVCNKLSTSSSDGASISSMTSRLHNFSITPERSIYDHQSTASPLSISRRSSINHQGLSMEPFLVPLVCTHFVEWSAKAFMQSNDCINTQKEIRNLSDFSVSTRLLSKSSERRTIGVQRLDEQIFYQKNPGVPCVMMFHPTHSSLVVGDVNHVTIWVPEGNHQRNHWNNLNCGSTKISSLSIINPETPHICLAVGCDDGCVRVWKDPFNFHDETENGLKWGEYEDKPSGSFKKPHLLTAFQALEDTYLPRRGKGIIMNWVQNSSSLLVAGDSNKIRMWDLVSEYKVADFSTNSSITTSLHALNGESSWFVAGFVDGYIRLFDWRRPRPIVRQWKDFSSCVITTQLFKASNEDAQFVGAAESGQVKMYDVRRTSSVTVCDPVDNQKAHAMAYQSRLHLVAVCTSQTRGPRNHQITINHASGPRLNTIQFHDSLVSSRTSHINCLTFHPTKALLAVGTAEGCISAYGIPKR